MRRQTVLLLLITHSFIFLVGAGLSETDRSTMQSQLTYYTLENSARPGPLGSY